ncbi:hypothetical protein NDU88_003970 [Pleurodeles waltl]|uniref:Uncharacterized protein n=1 Tax=Pleurodeles waltl TaxID=8319 RepID=A0AAV7QDI4_PLEWA|nr:hypothetical protein NDU88_003970 [Pleurodeles waltl]
MLGPSATPDSLDPLACPGSQCCVCVRGASNREPPERPLLQFQQGAATSVVFPLRVAGHHWFIGKATAMFSQLGHTYTAAVRDRRPQWKAPLPAAQLDHAVSRVP